MTTSNRWRSIFFIVLVGVFATSLTLFVATSKNARAQANAVLSGSVKSDTGAKLEGVTVSGRSVGRTITTSVFTDEDGNYYFPRMAEGKYRVWAQAEGFE